METEMLVATCRVELAAVPAGAQPTGEFVAIVATFDVVDANNRIIRRGAFAESIAAWQRSGDRLPVIFSHGDTPKSFIGEVDPAGLEETGEGLRARGRLDLEDPDGAKVHRLLSRRTLKEWSFAAIVEKARTLESGVREISKARLIELGPCLVGAGLTRTLHVASRHDTSVPRTVTPLEARRVALAALDRQLTTVLAATGRSFSHVL